MTTPKYSGASIIALDAMGGDHGVESVVPGAALAHKCNPRLSFIIFGDEHEIRPVLARHSALAKVSQIVHTDKKIRANDKPSAILRSSKGTSMRMAIEAVKAGEADAVVSSGNTGALMALSKTVLRMLEGIHRPALASIFPTLTGRTIMLDLGANVLVDAENLVEFAVLGSVFARAHLGSAEPTVGLLNVGSEEMKGPDHVRSAAAILSEIEIPGRYVGFVEGTDITKGTVDVVVSDGYAGNIALKSAEGVSKLSSSFFRKEFTADPLAMMGAFLGYFALKRIKKRVDPRYYNGGVFLGLNGLCVKSHGGTDAVGFCTAVKLAASLAGHGYIQQVVDDMKELTSRESLVS